jgi:hypothetical protein
MVTEPKDVSTVNVESVSAVSVPETLSPDLRKNVFPWANNPPISKIVIINIDRIFIGSPL